MIKQASHNYIKTRIFLKAFLLVKVLSYFFNSLVNRGKIVLNLV